MFILRDLKWLLFVQSNTEREEALAILGQEGMLLVLPSYIDNMPYVVAEAAVGFPLMTVMTSSGVADT